MPAVFVHGVPDTHRMWDGVVSRLSRSDVVAVDLPGFSVPVPDGFDATKEGYSAWLLSELERLGPPIDLVGHDWGSILVQRAVSLRPELVRSWAAGGAAIDSEYRWHELARMWQTPGLGEQVMLGMTTDALREGLVRAGVPEADAAVAADRVDDLMKECILKLYRSAVNFGAEWQPDLEKVRKPALVIWGENDPYVPVDFGRRLADRVSGRLVVFQGCGHFWPQERPEETAQTLEEFWSELPALA